MELEFAGFQLRLVPLLEGFLLLGEALDPFGMGADDDLVPVIGQELAQERVNAGLQDVVLLPGGGDQRSEAGRAIPAPSARRLPAGAR